MNITSCYKLLLVGLLLLSFVTPAGDSVDVPSFDMFYGYVAACSVGSLLLVLFVTFSISRMNRTTCYKLLLVGLLLLSFVTPVGDSVDGSSLDSFGVYGFVGACSLVALLLVYYISRMNRTSCYKLLLVGVLLLSFVTPAGESLDVPSLDWFYGYVVACYVGSLLLVLFVIYYFSRVFDPSAVVYDDENNRGPEAPVTVDG